MCGEVPLLIALAMSLFFLLFSAACEGGKGRGRSSRPRKPAAAAVSRVKWKRTTREDHGNPRSRRALPASTSMETAVAGSRAFDNNNGPSSSSWLLYHFPFPRAIGIRPPRKLPTRKTPIPPLLCRDVMGLASQPATTHQPPADIPS
ncbi:hypothetical protein F5X96DRAFT_617703 [Biscogniauxia mediterranea]|nr:hypothetical protein F5X96DRAFT_617703 [Biscogniauxia mediterranea]